MPTIKEISHTPKYFVSDDGKVFSEKYGRRCELKQSEHKGYRRVALSTDNKRHGYPVHRLVAEAFIPNPNDKPFVNHIDGNKRNNVVSNLQWCTASENQKHAYDVLNIRNGHEGYQYAKLYPNEELRSRLVELGVPRWKHNLAELGEMLPKPKSEQDTEKYGTFRDYDGRWWAWETEEGLYDKNGEYIYADTEADARAKMLIYLIEKGIINPTEEGR